MQMKAGRVLGGMETERPAAASDGRRLSLVSLLFLRVVAAVLLIAADAWVVFEYRDLQKTVGEVTPMVIGGRNPVPQFTQLVDDCSEWAVVLASVGVLAALVYVWGAARFAIPVILATVGAASLCAVAGGAMRMATIEARQWYLTY